MPHGERAGAPAQAPSPVEISDGNRNASPASAVDARMARLERLLGSDEGFFLLALHSFVESFVLDVYPAGRGGKFFPTLLWDFKDFLKQKGRITVADQEAIVRITKEHTVANRVRHQMLRLDPEEAVAASHNFLGFCRACGIDHPFLKSLRDNLKAWQDKKSPMERSSELARLKFDLFTAQRENKKLMQQAAEARDADAKAAQLDADLRARTAELARERARADSKAERVDALRAELNGLEQQRKTLSADLERFRDLDLYVEHLNRFTVYTRTRRDYERSLMRLTAEQQEALDVISPGHDFLIRGGAGTGKTIVLLHAYGRARRQVASELKLGKPSRTVLLTYTTTLVKYDRYLAELLRTPEEAGLIQTADSFFLARLRAMDPGWRVEYDAVQKLAQRFNTTGFLSSGELATEVEDFLFAYMVTREEYVEDRVPRRGMRQPLSAAQRAQVWDIRDLVAGSMEDIGIFSKNYSRMKIIQHPVQDIDFAFVDEAQDLTAADLKALKVSCTRGVIMAGDTAQAIYGLGSPYKRAGIDISGRTRVLRTDFRTTCPIHDLAEKYRALCGADIEGDAVVTHAFREGPAPELYRAGSREELLKLLIEKASLFIDKLAYDPENVTVLAPSKQDLAAIQEHLARRGIKSANVRDEGFSFSEQGQVRLSTLHSSKGLDFPVVLLYLPSLPTGADYDEKASEGLARNLIYVAISRAMDNLNVFVMEEAREKVVQELMEVMSDAGVRKAFG